MTKIHKSDEAASDPEKPRHDMASLLRWNLTDLTRFAKSVAETPYLPRQTPLTLAIPVELRERPEADREHSIAVFECDPENRAMLDKLYELSHVDRSAVKKVVRPPYKSTIPGEELERTEVTLLTDHGFQFREISARQGDWANFSVVVELIEVTDIPDPSAV